LLPGLLFRRLLGMEVLTTDEIVRLTPPERLALIAQLWDSLEQEQLPLTGAQEAELERRLSSLDEDRHNGVSWASLRAELEQRLRSCTRLSSLRTRSKGYKILALAARGDLTRPS
jgi:putative addiction module component (TIGR02574 family)